MGSVHRYCNFIGAALEGIIAMVTRSWMRGALAAFLCAAVLFAGAALAAGYKGFARGEALITAEELKTLMDGGDGDLVIIAVANVIHYRSGHIPGAHAAWRGDYSAKAGGDYPYGGMVAGRADFQAFARRLGISAASTVVVYDHKYDATRLWWVFHLYGKTDLRVLDGGIGAWQAAGYETEILAPDAPEPGDFVAAGARPGWSVDASYVDHGRQSTVAQLWDVREDDEWSGETLRPGASRRGHIPGAEFVNWGQFRRPDGTFLDAAEMAAMVDGFGFDPSREQIFYCQSGVRATQEIFGLYLLGWDTSRLHNFDGAWIAWSHDEALPVLCEAC